jgi:hypothetical protein
MASDELSFPTAIVPTRPGAPVERFKNYTRAFGDPMGVLFREMATATKDIFTVDGGTKTVPDREVRRECAKELMPYGYPKLRASEVTLAAPGGAIQININIGKPAEPPTIDVTPPDPLE